jgi:hypothetical protein
MSFAGIDRTLVAVGTVSDVSIFDANDLAIPLRGVTDESTVCSDGREATGA